MFRKINLYLLAITALSIPYPAYALEAFFINNSSKNIEIKVQNNNCVTYVGTESTKVLPPHTAPWKMNLGDRNTGGCSTSYMLAWGVYADQVKIGDISFDYQSGIHLNTNRNITDLTPPNFYICSNSGQHQWDGSYVFFTFGYQFPTWPCSFK